MAIRQQHLPKTSQCHITLAITFAKNNIVQKIAGLTNTVTPSCVEKMPGVNISSDLEEAMFETGESLSVYS